MEMHTPNGLMQMWFAGEFIDVVTDRRLVYTEFMADEKAKPMSEAIELPAGHTTTTEVRVELEDIWRSDRGDPDPPRDSQ